MASQFSIPFVEDSVLYPEICNSIITCSIKFQSAFVSVIELLVCCICLSGNRNIFKTKLASGIIEQRIKQNYRMKG